MEKINNSNTEKIRLFALIEPLNLRMSLCFTTDSLVADIIKFVEDMIKKFLPKFKVGRVEWNGAWILPQYKIVDFFEDKTEIKIYSLEYGLTLKTMAQDRDKPHVFNSAAIIEEINTRFISKKTSRDKKKKTETNISKEEYEDNEEDFNIPDTNMIEVNPIIQSEDLHVLSNKQINKGKDIPKDILKEVKLENPKDTQHPSHAKQNIKQQQQQQQTKKKGDTTPTKINVQQSQIENKKKAKHQQPPQKITKHSSNSNSDDEEEKKVQKLDGKKYMNDSNETSSAAEEEMEDIPYQQKTNQIPDRKLNEKKVK